MKNHKSPQRVVVTATIYLLVVASSLAISGRTAPLSQQPTTQDQTVEDKLALRDALRRGGLREAAKLKGNYIAEFDPHWDFGFMDTETLTKGSAAVVVGRFTKKLDPRLLEGSLICTDYEVTVDELIKGDLNQKKVIVVTIPGGRISFEDGTSAEQTTPTFEQPRIGRAYTVFLMEEQAIPSIFFLYGGPLGLFDIEDSSSVKSHGKPDYPAAVESNGKNRELFLENVRKLARKWPKPGKCCD
jgi:hypothetical protein